MHRLTGLRSAAVLWFALSLLGTAAFGARDRAAQQAPKTANEVPAIAPRELVRRVVENELKASQDDHTHYMYKDRRQTLSGAKTKLMVETKQGTVAYLLAIDDKPLTTTERAQEEQRLQKLLSDPEEQAKKKKDQQQDNDRVVSMFRQLPNAFLYTYDGTMPGSNGHEWVKLKFVPDPNYDPPSRETSVFKAMSGTMVVDPVAERLAKIQATLFKDVSFGWGILGHLDQGGHFIVEQNNIGDARWEPTYMNIQFTGKALLFKTINMHQVETTSDYVRVPDNLTIAQGVDMLKKRVDGVMAENANGNRR
ncbi:MAG TPA: hypothetical protein VFM10_10005 [Terriglobales bacterium]|nr:hypothetical protein [Terriglobales bacterium]